MRVHTHENLAFKSTNGRATEYLTICLDQRGNYGAHALMLTEHGYLTYDGTPQLSHALPHSGCQPEHLGRRGAAMQSISLTWTRGVFTDTSNGTYFKAGSQRLLK
eukprot:TRINITY_DN10905_c0_g1_i1.p2 TRINITY_DN10905_c0_g1~~TRINITY_DN10905_c0_g1_i1.p2  ORF type:complete len:105 (+),score=1.06 TRINITY_DN10905_c0_g1_i1:286-600(+)